MKKINTLLTALVLALAVINFSGCSTTTTTMADGTKTVTHKLDAGSTAAVTDAVLQVLNSPAGQAALSKIPNPK